MQWRIRPLRAVVFASCLVSSCAFAQQGAAKLPSFEVSTVKPAKPDSNGQSWHTKNNMMTIENLMLVQLIKSAYGLKSDSQVLQAPEWVSKEHFDVTAKTGDEEYQHLGKLKGDEGDKEYRALLQSLLAERFGLVVSEEKRTMPVYALLVDAGGSKLTPFVLPPVKDGEPEPDVPHSMSTHNGHMDAGAIGMDSLASSLSDKYEVGHRVVIDRTGLTGDFNFKLDWAPDRGMGISADATEPGLMTALREQLGLRLEKQDGEVPVVVVKSVVRPQFD
jgi:uncharacterized protein (TIGR03435 family)